MAGHSEAMKIIAERNGAMHSDESVAYGLAFAADPTDTFIVTYPKCGTTWVSQILHQLRSKGHMEFEEITAVVPWDILAQDCGQKLEDPQQWSPRLFKSHEPFPKIAKGGKYVYVARNPMDSFVSFHKFLPGYMGADPNGLPMEEFASSIFAGVSQAGQIWHHFLGWWEKRGDPNVLWVFFEDLKEDLRGQIKRIADFIEVDADDELLDIAETHSTYKYMAEHNAQFDDHFVFDARKVAMGMAADAKIGVSKVRKGGGKTGSGSAIPEAVRALLLDKWATVITAKHPELATYEKMRALGSGR